MAFAAVIWDQRSHALKSVSCTAYKLRTLKMNINPQAEGMHPLIVFPDSHDLIIKLSSLEIIHFLIVI